MKTIRVVIFLLVIGLSNVATIKGQGLSAEATRFKTNLLTFMREEGYLPNVSSDGTRINFKNEGESYWIDLAGSMPVQVTMHIEGFTNKDANVMAILLACNDVNRDNYYVKAYVSTYDSEGSTGLSIEFPCHTAEEFRYVFKECIRSLAASKKDIQEKYDKYNSEMAETNAKKTPISISHVAIGITDGNNKTIAEYGNKLYSSQTKYLTPRIMAFAESAGTYDIYCKLYTPSGTLSTGSTSPNGYSWKYSLKMHQGNGTYLLSGWGSDKYGNWPIGDYVMELYYDGILLITKKFTIY